MAKICPIGSHWWGVSLVDFADRLVMTGSEWTRPVTTGLDRERIIYDPFKPEFGLVLSVLQKDQLMMVDWSFPIIHWSFSIVYRLFLIFYRFLYQYLDPSMVIVDHLKGPKLGYRV